MKDPFEYLLVPCPEKVHDTYYNILDTLCKEQEYEMWPLEYHEVHEHAFAIAMLHFKEQLNGSFYFGRLDEFIEAMEFKKRQLAYTYIMGKEGIEWQEDGEDIPDPFYAMMEKLLVKKANWWLEYMRQRYTEDERIALFENMFEDNSTPASQSFMYAIKLTKELI